MFLQWWWLFSNKLSFNCIKDNFLSSYEENEAGRVQSSPETLSSVMGIPRMVLGAGREADAASTECLGWKQLSMRKLCINAPKPRHSKVQPSQKGPGGAAGQAQLIPLLTLQRGDALSPLGSGKNPLPSLCPWCSSPAILPFFLVASPPPPPRRTAEFSASP